jgi:DeoR family fructose operon transcriptional repressor
VPKHQDAMLAEVRMRSILDIVRVQGEVTVADLCRTFGVSPATVRNDLNRLERTNLLKRTHGGAISSQRAGYELTTVEKQVRNVREKCAIAEVALRFISPGDSIVLDTGTTTFELARRLVGIEGLTVMTNDTQIATCLEANGEANVMLVGGVIRRNYHCTVGQYAVDFITNLHVDKAFIAANAIAPERGLSTPSVELAGVKSKFIDIAEQVYVMADSSKIDKNSFALVTPLSQIDVLIMDSGAPESFVSQIESQGVHVELAHVRQNGNEKTGRAQNENKNH